MNKMRCLPLFAALLIPMILSAQNGPSADRERGQVNGDPIWRQALGGEVTGLPAVQVQSAVVVLDGGNIKAYSAGGMPLWNYSARGRLSPFVTRSREGTSYISRTNGTFIAVNRAGRELWRLNPGGPLSGPVVSGWDGRLFVPTGKRISCYTASGNLLWLRNFETAISVSPVLDQRGGILFALDPSDVPDKKQTPPSPPPGFMVLRVDQFGGIRRWEISSQPQTILPLSPDLNGASRFMILCKNGNIEILGSSQDWYVPAEAGNAPQGALPRLPAPPLAAASRGDNAAVTLDDGRVLLISGQNGQIKWTADSHIRVRGRSAADSEAHMVYDERGIYVLSKSGATGFSVDGKRLWFTTLENAAAIPAFGDDGILYSGGRDWILYAYKLEERSLPQKPPLYGPAPESSYGTGNPPPSSWADSPFRFDETWLKNRLEIIGAAVRSGRIGTNELDWTAYLMETAGGDYRPHADITHPPVNIQYRVQALALLGIIGSQETIPWLVNVFRRDIEPTIKAAAAEAIGAIGVDPGGIAIQAFFEAALPTSSILDDHTLSAVAAATGAFCRFSGPPLSETGSKILTLLIAPDRPRVVRQQALRELNTLRL
jgi:outer membrane protein assembly factor BamB